MIPYTIERRHDSGVTNVTLGIWLFLASEVMLFGALFSCYALLRTAAESWPVGSHVLSLSLGSLNTAILIVATMTIWRGRRGDSRQRRRALTIATVLALAFLAVKGTEYSGEIARGLAPATNTFMAMYFVLTGVHALHVIGGIVANTWAIAGARAVGDAMTGGRAHALALYWTLVDVVWLIIFALMYLS